MKDTYGKKQYTCKCGQLTEGYVWFGKIKETQFECTKCGKCVGYNNLKPFFLYLIVERHSNLLIDNGLKVLHFFQIFFELCG